MENTIINILNHLPAYNTYHKKSKPEISWETKDNNWVGLLEPEWPDLLGNEILRLTDKFEYEVWQPDNRADKIYSHTFPNGLVHKLIPTEKKKSIYGLKKITEISPDNIIEEIKRLNNRKILLNFNGGLDHFNLKIVKALKTIPKIHIYHGTIRIPLKNTSILKKNILSLFNDYRDYQSLKNNINDLDYITYQTDINVDTIKKIYNGPLLKLTMGCDFNNWKKLEKKEARKDLGLPQDKKVLLWSSRLNRQKQIDKFIEVLNTIDNNLSYLFVITGHGKNKFEKILQQKSRKLIEDGKIIFSGYQRGDVLKKYYSAADLFIHASDKEGGPVSVMKALASEIPVFQTKVGSTCEILEKENAGILVDKYDYKAWRSELIEFLKGGEVQVLDRDKAKKLYHWPNIARKFIKIYNSC